jgi:NPCBM/NEW2 domain
MPDQTRQDGRRQDDGPASGNGQPSARRTFRPEVVTAIGGLLVGVAAVGGLIVQSIQRDDAAPATTQNASPPTTLTPPSDDTTTAPGAAQPTTSGQPSEPSTQYLADLEPISGGMPETTPQEMGKKSYLRSISAETGGCARNQQAAFVYDLGARFRSFDAVVGLTNQSNAAARVEVRVTADDDRLFTAIVRVGQPQPVHVAVTGKIQLMVQQRYLGPEPNLCSEAGDVVWGDARIA